MQFASGVFYWENMIDEKLEAELKTFKAPKDGKDLLPYVLYWRDANYLKCGEMVTSKELTCLRCVGSNGTSDKILYYQNKEGWRLVGYWFPELEQYTDCKKLCESLIHSDPSKVKALADENEALKAKVEALSAKMKHGRD